MSAAVHCCCICNQCASTVEPISEQGGRLRLTDFPLCVFVCVCLCGSDSGVIFKGTTIGMAPLEGMCSLENSGGINVVRGN